MRLLTIILSPVAIAVFLIAYVFIGKDGLQLNSYEN